VWRCEDGQRQRIVPGQDGERAPGQEAEDAEVQQHGYGEDAPLEPGRVGVDVRDVDEVRVEGVEERSELRGCWVEGRRDGVARRLCALF